MNAVAEKSETSTRVVISFEEWMFRELTEMAMDAYNESDVMRKFEYSEVRVQETIAMAIFAPERLCGFACVDMEKKRILGVLVATVAGVYWSLERVANDVIVYVRPEARDSFVAKRLLEAYEKWAKKMSIKKIFFIQTTGVAPLRTTKFLELLGWRHIGSQMMKEIP